MAYDGTDGLWLAREHSYDAIVLDLMLPGITGYKVCETLRGEKNWTPILMLTESSDRDRDDRGDRDAEDRNEAYEVEIRTTDGTEADGTQWDVDLDASFAVVHKSVDR